MFDRVRNSWLLFKVRDVGVGDVFNVIAGFLSDRVQRVVVDGVHSEDVVGVPQGCIGFLCCFLLQTCVLSMIFLNTLHIILTVFNE